MLPYSYMFDFFEKHKEENPGILIFIGILVVLFIITEDHMPHKKVPV